MKMPIAIIFLLLASNTIADLSKCLKATDFDTQAKIFLEHPFKAEFYMSTKKFLFPPTSSHIKLGSGTFGLIVRADLKYSVNKSMPAVFKAIKYGEKEEELNRELGILQNISRSFPLYLVIYYNCVEYKEKGSVLIFTEFLDSDLHKKHTDAVTSISNRSLFRAFADQPFVKKVELLLTMAMGVLVLHENGYIHFDIKPENYMVKNSDPPIVKIIDYGFSMKYDENITIEAKGTPEYVDPSMINYGYKMDYRSDIYSLGYTFIFAFFNIFKSADENPHDGLSVAKKILSSAYNRYRNVSNEINDYRYEIPRDKNNDLSKIEKSVQIIKNMFKAMIDLDITKRPTINEVVLTLTYIIYNLDEESIYLPKKSNELLRKIYQNENMAYTPYLATQSLFNFLNGRTSLNSINDDQLKDFNYINRMIKTFGLISLNDISEIKNDSVKLPVLKNSTVVENNKNILDVNSGNNMKRKINNPSIRLEPILEKGLNKIEARAAQNIEKDQMITENNEESTDVSEIQVVVKNQPLKAPEFPPNASNNQESIKKKIISIDAAPQNKDTPGSNTKQKANDATSGYKHRRLVKLSELPAYVSKNQAAEHNYKNKEVEKLDSNVNRVINERGQRNNQIRISVANETQRKFNGKKPSDTNQKENVLKKPETPANLTKVEPPVKAVLSKFANIGNKARNVVEAMPPRYNYAKQLLNAKDKDSEDLKRNTFYQGNNVDFLYQYGQPHYAVHNINFPGRGVLVY